MPPTPNLSLPLIEAGQAQKHVTHNEALRLLDDVVQLAVVAVSVDPPISPTNGERHIVGAAASGEFAGHENEIAAFQDGGWAFLLPRPGWRAWQIDEAKLRVWTGSAWSEISSSGGGGSGDVAGPQGGVADGDIAVFAGTTGKAIHRGRGAIDYLGVGTAPETTSSAFQSPGCACEPRAVSRHPRRGYRPARATSRYRFRRKRPAIAPRSFSRPVFPAAPSSASSRATRSS